MLPVTFELYLLLTQEDMLPVTFELYLLLTQEDRLPVTFELTQEGSNMPMK